MAGEGGIMTKEAAQGIGCLALLGVIGAVWLGTLFGDPEPEISEMALPDHFAAIIPEGGEPAAVEAAAREICKDRRWCKVLGWTDKANAAKTLPMLARESDAVVFSYFVNRGSGGEVVLWACKSFPQKDPARCLSE